MQIHAVIFDMDGLMLDSEPLYRAAWQKAAADCGFALSDAQYSRYVGRRNEEAEEFLFEDFGSKFPVDRFRIALGKQETRLFAAAAVQKKGGVEELLSLLDWRQVPKAVATSTNRDKAAGRLSAAGLVNRFDVLATGDEVVNGKPSPELFLLAAQRLNIAPSRCLVLEDAEPGVIAAHRAEMQVYMVPDLKLPSASVEQLANGIFDSLIAVALELELTSFGYMA
jgi:HAD superfamily hydrolase (TIGR01509 family)